MLDTWRPIDSLLFDSIQESGTAVIDGTSLHTLVAGEKLEKYEGAAIGAEYLAQSDGMKKQQSLAGTKRGPGVTLTSSGCGPKSSA